MVRLIAALFATLLALSACGVKHPVPNDSEAVGMVVDVHWPSRPGYHKFDAGNGDFVTGRYDYYRPPGSKANYQVKQDYNVIVIKKPISKIAAYIVFEGTLMNEEQIREHLGSLYGEVLDVDPTEKALEPGDMVYIKTDKENGLTKVMMDFRRGDKNTPVADISFLNHYRRVQTDELDPAAPYIPYISEIE